MRLRGLRRFAGCLRSLSQDRYVADLRPAAGLQISMGIIRPHGWPYGILGWRSRARHLLWRLCGRCTKVRISPWRPRSFAFGDWGRFRPADCTLCRPLSKVLVAIAKVLLKLMRWW